MTDASDTTRRSHEPGGELEADRPADIAEPPAGVLGNVLEEVQEHSRPRRAVEELLIVVDERGLLERERALVDGA